MPVNDFNVGRDLTFSIFDQNTGINGAGTILNFTIVTKFSRKQETSEIKVKGIDGVCRYAFTPDGWKGDIELTRADSSVDDYFAQLEALYFGGATILNGQITETFTEVSGNVSQYRYVSTAMAFEDAGTIEGDKEIKLKIKWAASFRQKV